MRLFVNETAFFVNKEIKGIPIKYEIEHKMKFCLENDNEEVV